MGQGEDDDIMTVENLRRRLAYGEAGELGDVGGILPQSPSDGGTPRHACDLEAGMPCEYPQGLSTRIAGGAGYCNRIFRHIVHFPELQRIRRVYMLCTPMHNYALECRGRPGKSRPATRTPWEAPWTIPAGSHSTGGEQSSAGAPRRSPGYTQRAQHNATASRAVRRRFPPPTIRTHPRAEMTSTGKGRRS